MSSSLLLTGVRSGWLSIYIYIYVDLLPSKLRTMALQVHLFHSPISLCYLSNLLAGRIYCCGYSLLILYNNFLKEKNRSMVAFFVRQIELARNIAFYIYIYKTLTFMVGLKQARRRANKTITILLN